jgi:hypothetical protein
MKAACEGRALYQALRKIEYEEESGGLFREPKMVVNIGAINANGQGQVQISGTGNNRSTGATTTQVAVDTLGTIREIKELLTTAPLSSDDLDLVCAEVEAVEKDPSQENLKGLVGVLEKFDAALKAGEGVWDRSASLAGKIALLASAAGLM